MKTMRVPLTGRHPVSGKYGHVVAHALIDEADFTKVNGYSWSLGTTGYAKRGIPKGAKERNTLMHRFLLGISDPAVVVDHINGDRLDNRRSNLRTATPGENNANSAGRRSNSSGYKGVTWDKARGKWAAQIQVQGRCIRAGRFDSKFTAAEAHDFLAMRHFGRYARLNFPDRAQEIFSRPDPKEW